MFIYLLKQEKENRFKIGKCTDHSRILSLCSTCGKFDRDSKMFGVPKKTLKKEKALHTLLDSYRINDLEKKDGYTEFFSLDCFDMVHSFLSKLYPVNGDNGEIDYRCVVSEELEELIEKQRKSDLEFISGDDIHNWNQLIIAYKRNPDDPLREISGYWNLTLEERKRLTVELIACDGSEGAKKIRDSKLLDIEYSKKEVLIKKAIGRELDFEEWMALRGEITHEEMVSFCLEREKRGELDLEHFHDMEYQESYDSWLESDDDLEMPVVEKLWRSKLTPQERVYVEGLDVDSMSDDELEEFAEKYIYKWKRLTPSYFQYIEELRQKFVGS